MEISSGFGHELRFGGTPNGEFVIGTVTVREFPLGRIIPERGTIGGDCISRQISYGDRFDRRGDRFVNRVILTRCVKL